MVLQSEEEKHFCVYCRNELASHEKNYHSDCKKAFDKFNYSRLKAVHTLFLKISFFIAVFVYSNSFFKLSDLFSYELALIGPSLDVVLVIPVILALYFFIEEGRSLPSINIDEFFIFILFDYIITLGFVILNKYYSNYYANNDNIEMYITILSIIVIYACGYYIFDFFNATFRKSLSVSLLICFYILICFLVVGLFLSLLFDFINFKISSFFPYEFYANVTVVIIFLLFISFLILRNNKIGKYFNGLVINKDLKSELKILLSFILSGLFIDIVVYYLLYLSGLFY